MPLGAFRLTSLAMTATVSGPAPGRTAVNSIAQGNAQIDTAQSKFGGSSLLLDGSGDYLQTDLSVSSTQTEFTWECWFRLSSLKNDMFLYQGDNGVSDARHQIWITGPSRPTHANEVIVVTGSGGSYTFNVNFTATTWATNTWYHLAVTRNASNSITVWVNGVSKGSVTDSKAFFSGGSTNPLIGYSTYSAGADFPGHIDELRISTVDRYPGAFTPQGIAFTNDNDTVFLMHADGVDGSTTIDDDNSAAIRDSVTTTAYNDAQISTTQNKFLSTSGYFNGGTYPSTADYVTADIPDTIGTGDFTVEFWVWDTTTGGQHYFAFVDSTGNNGWELRMDTSQFRIYDKTSGTFTTQFTAVDLSHYRNQWQHVAISRSSGVWNLFVNGTKSSLTPTYAKDLTGMTVNIGAGQQTGYASLNGYIDDLRISNIARYTSSFTPSTTTLVNDSDTLLLLHFEGANASTTFTDHNF
jgi:hypothetical protein